jgi:hypothetical protein
MQFLLELEIRVFPLTSVSSWLATINQEPVGRCYQGDSTSEREENAFASRWMSEIAIFVS